MVNGQAGDVAMKCRAPAGWLTFPAKRADEPSPFAEPLPV